MSRVPQAKGGAKSNLAKALAADTREAGSGSGRTSDKGQSPSRSRSPRRAVPLHAAWKHDTVLSRRWTFAAQRRRVSCDRDHDACRNHVRHLFLQIKISGAGGFQRVCGSASFWSTGVWPMLRVLVTQMDWQLGQR